MSKGRVDLRWIAAATAVVLATVAVGLLLFKLLDILLLVFLAVILAAAVQPWHTRLCRWGVSKGIAVLLIYSSFLVALFALSFLVLPVLLEQVTTVVGELPSTYASLRMTLGASQMAVVRLVGSRLPPFERLTVALTQTPELYHGVLGATAGVFAVLSYAALILVLAFYWTMDVPRIERFFLSWLPVARRTSTLNAWREIEFKLGAFVRGQCVVMLAVGLCAGVSYAVIGLPNALALGVTAGLLEAIPILGPLLGAAPAMLVALPLGPHMVLLVFAIAVFIQLLEGYALSPVVMRHAVGVSALIGLLSILAFGALYGMLGVLIAIPVAAVGQVLFDAVIAEKAVEVQSGPEPLVELRRRLRNVRERARERMRTRESRMGIDPELADHVVDAVDQRIEEAAERIEALLAATDEAAPAASLKAMIEELQIATESIEKAVDRVDAVENDAARAPTAAPMVRELSQTADQVQHAVERAEALAPAAKDDDPTSAEDVELARLGAR